MPPRPGQKSETTRSQILAAAYRLFLDRGYHGTSLRDIVDRSGVTTGGVYNHFKSKAEIFEAVFEEYHPYRQVIPALLSAQGETVDAYAHDAARRMLAVLGENRDALNLMFVEIVEFHGAHFSALYEKAGASAGQFAGRLAGLTEHMRPIPLPVLARSFVGLFFSYFMTNAILSEAFPNDEASLSQFVDIYLYGVLPDGRPS